MKAIKSFFSWLKSSWVKALVLVLAVLLIAGPFLMVYVGKVRDEAKKIINKAKGGATADAADAAAK